MVSTIEMNVNPLVAGLRLNERVCASRRRPCLCWREGAEAVSDKLERQMLEAVAAYAGPVTRCPPGEAMAKPVKPKTGSGTDPVFPNKVLPLRRKPKPISIVVETQTTKRDQAARWLERHDRSRRKSWRRSRRRHWLGAAGSSGTVCG
jgi:hypothetical protein